MRRIYHRFPLTIDLDFDIDRSFRDVLSCIQKMNASHTTERRGPDLVKLGVAVRMSDDRSGFESLEGIPSLAEVVSDLADFRIEIQETLLRGDGRYPIASDVFLVRVADKGPRTECIVVREGGQGTMDAMDFKRMFKGACE